MISILVDEWRASADAFREHAQVSVAIAYERCADRLEELLEDARSTPLTLKEASEFGGYSEDHLGRLVREGAIPNAGRKGAPRISRADVPIKAGSVAPAPSSAEVDREQIVRSVIDEGVG